MGNAILGRDTAEGTAKLLEAPDEWLRRRSVSKEGARRRLRALAASQCPSRAAQPHGPLRGRARRARATGILLAGVTTSPLVASAHAARRPATRSVREGLSPDVGGGRSSRAVGSTWPPAMRPLDPTPPRTRSWASTGRNPRRRGISLDWSRRHSGGGGAGRPPREVVVETLPAGQLGRGRRVRVARSRPRCGPPAAEDGLTFEVPVEVTEVGLVAAPLPGTGGRREPREAGHPDLAPACGWADGPAGPAHHSRQGGVAVVTRCWPTPSGGRVVRPMASSAHATGYPILSGLVYPTVYLTREEVESCDLPPGWPAAGSWSSGISATRWCPCIQLSIQPPGHRRPGAIDEAAHGPGVLLRGGDTCGLHAHPVGGCGAHATLLAARRSAAGSLRGARGRRGRRIPPPPRTLRSGGDRSAAGGAPQARELSGA